MRNERLIFEGNHDARLASRRRAKPTLFLGVGASRFEKRNSNRDCVDDRTRQCCVSHLLQRKHQVELAHRHAAGIF
ncbi:MAG: hypothetical protein JRD92_08335 [Deltaproteobacteria bacterium]|nr:hypothetical protein [Deltaproteobacteria bacterium]